MRKEHEAEKRNKNEANTSGTEKGTTTWEPGKRG